MIRRIRRHGQKPARGDAERVRGLEIDVRISSVARPEFRGLAALRDPDHGTILFFCGGCGFRPPPCEKPSVSV
jgi:hypothetical protein